MLPSKCRWAFRPRGGPPGRVGSGPGPPAAGPRPRSRSTASSGRAASRMACRSAASSSRPGSSSRVVPSPRCTPRRVAATSAGRAAAGATGTAAAAKAAGGSRQNPPRRARPPAPGRVAAATCAAWASGLDCRPPPPGARAARGAAEAGAGWATRASWVSVAPASSCWMATRGRPLAWRRLTATSWRRWRGPYRAVRPRWATGRSIRPMVVYQRMARRSGTARTRPLDCPA